MNTIMRSIQFVLKWVLAAMLLLPAVATAHVALLDPPALQVKCYSEPDFWSGNPADPGCRRLNNMSGTYPGQQWPEVAKLISSDDGYDYNNQETVEMLIPKGKLCSAADPLKEGLNIVSGDWHSTPVQLKNGVLPILIGGGIVHTPSDLYIYLTKPGFDPTTMVLGWNDLVLLKKEIINNSLTTPPPNFTVLFPTNSYYTTDVNVPSGQTGDAILFMRNQRHDRLGEGFYNCARITINDGGSVPVRWHAKGPFIPQGFAPKVGDTIRYREFSPDESKNEQFDVRLLVTNADPRVWALALMDALKPYSDKVQVGVLKDDKVVPDTTTLTNNQNYLSKANGSIAMSITPGGGGGDPDPRPPIANIQGPSEATEGETVTFDGQRSIGYNDTLTYSWATNAAESSPPNHAKVFTFKVGAYVAPAPGNPPANYLIKLGVYDAKNRQNGQKEIPFTIKKRAGSDEYPAWKPNGGYNSGSKVSNHGMKFECKPGGAGAWCGQNENEPGKPQSTFWQRAWDVVP